ncbi:TPA: DNA (cytosine-5-)-methyltransferase [Streptococcus suis]|nr:DNA (cytosine-5-)-methyltransferase [Streptococcus suis]
MTNLTMGSLFSGSGGFELASQMVGITPIWNSEVEPFPILVTRKNLPRVKHLGNIEKIDGSKIDPVDIITFGSPCQDLSIAGKREGLDGSKSNLFYEAIRILKEMRDKTNGEKPRYIIWENVPGAFSSNKGEDFRCVLEEICKIKEDKTFIPKATKWSNSGSIVGREFSLCWRVLDARYFGVPQRRRRIFLVTDFNGQRAGEILFDQESLSGDIKQSETSRKETARSFRKSTTICLNDHGGERMDVTNEYTPTLRAKGNRAPCVFENHGQDSRFNGPLEISPTIGANLGLGGNNQPLVVNAKTYDIRLTSENTKNVRANIYETDTSRTIDTGGNNPDRNQGGLAVVYSTSKNSHHTIANTNEVGTLVATDYKDPPIVNERNFKVRRLTPTECGRLQGFPDNWCEDLSILNPTTEELNFWKDVFEEYRIINGKIKSKSEKQIRKWLLNPYSDSAQYKMWGNGIALPCVVYIMKKLVTISSKS